MSPPPPQPEPVRPGRVLPVLFLGVLTVALDIALVASALPALRSYFGVDERAVSWVLSLFVLFTLVGLPLMAKLSDLYGRRAIYLADLALFLLGGVVVIVSERMDLLLVGRCLQGLGASGIFPVASAVIGDLYPPERRGRALGVLGAVYGLAFTIGPILGGLLVRFGWRWPFVVNLSLAVLVLMLSVRLVPNTRVRRTARFDWPGALTLGALLAALAYGINRLDTRRVAESLLSLDVAPFLLVAVVLLPVFLWIERRAQDPVLRLSLVRRRQVILASLLAAGAGMTEAVFVFMADFATAAFTVEPRTASYMLLPLVSAVALGAPVAGRILDRVGSRTIVLVGTVLMAVGLGLVGGAPVTRAMFYTGSVAIGLGLAGLLGSALSYILLNEARVEERAVAQGVITIFISVGQLVGAALIGAVAASSGSGAAGYRTAFLVVAGCCTVLGCAALGLKSRRLEHETAVG